MWSLEVIWSINEEVDFLGLIYERLGRDKTRVKQRPGIRIVFQPVMSLMKKIFQKNEKPPKFDRQDRFFS